MQLYSSSWQGYRFRMNPDSVAVLKDMPDFEGRELPALAEDFLRTRAEVWADALASAGAGPGDFDVTVDAHERRAKLSRAGSLVFKAEI
ncbi:MAG TPA: hypothetical protein VE007_02140 [Thermoanaerobaculia bacterium]|nr:hypothetical protein [Thermoanaerobaculia bacterium]